MNQPIRKITTEDMRSYLSQYQEWNGCSKVTVDNVRRNILYSKKSNAPDS